eukprot:TRINITY_DN2185_c0_g1_i1.p1 TRINITY_DN2185_c0_g1~~TRINITY_DN2185_c0_g1_i1.p1  ORF type:complete len:327 (-),score=61.43 TRINITY_DN2185_c0_g1_i1:38-1018(-)
MDEIPSEEATGLASPLPRGPVLLLKRTTTSNNETREQDNEPKVKLLTPQTSPLTHTSGRSPVGGNDAQVTTDGAENFLPSSKTLKERKEEYARARARIFNEEPIFSSSSEEDEEDSNLTASPIQQQQPSLQQQSRPTTHVNPTHRPLTDSNLQKERPLFEPSKMRQYHSEEPIGNYPQSHSRSTPTMLTHQYPNYPVSRNHGRPHNFSSPSLGTCHYGPNSMVNPTYCPPPVKDDSINFVPGGQAYVPSIKPYPVSGQNRAYTYYPVSSTAPVYLAHNAAPSGPFLWGYPPGAYPGVVMSPNPGYMSSPFLYTDTPNNFKQDHDTQ